MGMHGVPINCLLRRIWPKMPRMSDESDEIYEKFHRAMVARAPQVANSDENYLPAADKMEIYKAIAQLRLLSCIRTAYPKTFDAMNKDEFERLALKFIQANPPKTNDLRDYPVAFAQFVCDNLDDAHVCAIVRSEMQQAEAVDC